MQFKQSFIEAFSRSIVLFAVHTIKYLACGNMALEFALHYVCISMYINISSFMLHALEYK